MKLKICGMRPGDDLSFAADQTVAYMGLIFVPSSKRYVPPAEAATWLKQVHPQCPVIGVFVDEDAQTIQQIAEQVGLAGVQLHGQESPLLCQQLRAQGRMVWKSLQVHDTMTAAQLIDSVNAYAPAVDGILLDAAPPKGVHQTVTGGHGATFDWRILSSFFAAYERLPVTPDVWVAGGFEPGNVRGFHAACGFGGQSYTGSRGIDVSSGVETNGRKSTEKINQMIQVVSGLD